MESNDVSLVVGDVHCGPGQSLRRATWLGKHIAATRPARVVFIGDFLSFDSLSAWDRDKRRLMEARRYHLDVESGRVFLDLVRKGLPDNDCTPFIFIEGNHENRLARYLDHDPTFHGKIDYIRDIGFEGKVVPYKDSFVHRGVHFTHIPISENGAPIGGKYVASRALDVYGCPVVFGHTHKLNMACVHRKGMPHLQMAVNVGCFFEHIDEYAQGSQTSYWRGLVEINHYKRGSFDVNAIRMGHLKRMYDGGP